MIAVSLSLTVFQGDKRRLDFPIAAREIAEDLAPRDHADADEDSYFGVFVCLGKAPTEAELAASDSQNSVDNRVAKQ